MLIFLMFQTTINGNRPVIIMPSLGKSYDNSAGALTLKL